MNQSKNHFQKGVLILVIAMLFTIPSLQLYSAIGSYQTTSQSIVANKNYDKKQGTGTPKSFWNKSTLVAGLVAGLLGIAVYASKRAYDNGKAKPTHHAFDANYAKHDFSQFDN